MPETTKPTSESKSTAPVQPVAAGRFQAGEAAPATITTRVPRGVGEPAADTVASEPSAKSTQAAVKAAVDKDTEQGFRGANTDPTPNENYTVAGVTAGLPTPETVSFTPKAN